MSGPSESSTQRRQIPIDAVAALAPAAAGADADAAREAAAMAAGTDTVSYLATISNTELGQIGNLLFSLN